MIFLMIHPHYEFYLDIYSGRDTRCMNELSLLAEILVYK